MKKLFVFIATFVSSICFTQVIRINVKETISGYKIDSTSTNILDIITSELGYEALRTNVSDCLYEIDLSKKHLKYYVDNELSYECDIEFVNLETKYLINFLIDGYDIGMFVNLDVYNEQAIWFSFESEYKEIYTFSKFQIEKGS